MKETARYRQLADHYRRKIQLGELRPGDRLPPQTELANLHGMSVVTVRNALALLVEEGFVSRVRKRGTYVRDPESHANHHPTKGHRVGRVYFLFNDLSVQDLYSGVEGIMMRGISKECENRGLELRVHNCRDHFHIPGNMEDGYLLWGYSSKLMHAAETWSQQGYRLIALHNYFPHLSIPHMNSDNFTGGYLATHHLLSLGHRRIGAILPRRNEIMGLDVEFSFRVAGYHSALNHVGIVPNADLVRVVDRDLDIEFLSEQAMQELMSLEEPPTAVFASTDLAAVSAMAAAQERGLFVPDDVSIVGYDGLPFGQHTVPRLTTIDQGFYDIGADAVSALHETHANPTESLTKPSLIVRESTGVVGTSAKSNQIHWLV